MKEIIRNEFNLKSFLTKNKLFLLISLLLPIIIYFNSISGGLISDDFGLKKGVATFIFHFNIEFLESFLTYLWIALGLFLFGTNPTLFHFVNLLLHISNVFLVYLIISRLKGRNLAFFAALLFGIHPLLSEAVNWISAVGYLQADFFFLLSFYFYIFRGGSKNKYLLSILFYFLTVLTFNRTVLLFVLFYLYEFSFGPPAGGLKTNWKKLIPVTVISITIMLTFVALIPGRIKEINGVNAQTIDLSTYPLVLLYSLTSYLKLFFWPLPLSFFHSHFNVTTLEVIIRILGLAAYFSITIRAYFKNRFIFFWLSFFPLSLLLFLNPLGINWVVAERYVYLGSLGLIVPIAYFFRSLSSKKSLRVPVYILFGILIALLATRTFIRNFDWQSQTTLYQAIKNVYPNSPGAQAFISYQGSDTDQTPKDQTDLEKAITANPNLPQPYYDLGRYYQGKKDYQNAIKAYQQAVEKDANFYLAYQNMANSYFFLKELDRAIATANKAVTLHPDPNIYVNLGVFYQNKKDWQKAIEAFQNALKLDPKTPHAQEGLDQSKAMTND